MSKFVLVEAISQFRERYVIEVPDDHNEREYPCTAIAWAEDTVTIEEMKEFSFSLGGEYTYNNLFSVRTGYFYEDKTKGNRQFFSMGAGFKYSSVNLNLSYLIPSGSGVNRNPLSNTIRFGLVFDLGAQENY